MFMQQQQQRGMIVFSGRIESILRGFDAGPLPNLSLPPAAILRRIGLSSTGRDGEYDEIGFVYPTDKHIVTTHHNIPTVIFVHRVFVPESRGQWQERRREQRAWRQCRETGRQPILWAAIRPGNAQERDGAGGEISVFDMQSEEFGQQNGKRFDLSFSSDPCTYPRVSWQSFVVNPTADIQILTMKSASYYNIRVITNSLEKNNNIYYK